MKGIWTEFCVFFSQAGLSQFPGVKLKRIPLKTMGLLILSTENSALYFCYTKTTLLTHGGKYLRQEFDQLGIK